MQTSKITESSNNVVRRRKRNSNHHQKNKNKKMKFDIFYGNYVCPNSKMIVEVKIVE